MANVYSVNALATSMAERQLAYQNIQGNERAQMQRRMEYDFKVTGFNIATVTAIMAFVLTIFTGSLIVLALAVLTCCARRAFLKSAESTALVRPGGEIDADLLQRIADLDPVRRRNEIAAFLGVADANWQPTQLQLLDFKIWMGWAPVPAAVAQAERPQQQEEARAQALPGIVQEGPQAVGAEQGQARPADPPYEGIQIEVIE